MRKVEGALRGLLTGQNTHLDPIRTTIAPADLVRDCMRHGRAIELRPSSNEPAVAGDAAAFDQLSTCLTSAELAHFFALPEVELPGLPLREQATFALTPPRSDGRSIVLGHVLDENQRQLSE